MKKKGEKRIKSNKIRIDTTKHNNQIPAKQQPPCCLAILFELFWDDKDVTAIKRESQQ
jgi:hypothetical protein